MIDSRAGRPVAWGRLAFLCALPLLGWWLTGLFDLDEGFYAAIVGEMLRRGDWITPHYNGAPWFEKPILLYWLTMPSLAVFGEDFGPRLPAVLCTLGLYWTVWSFTRRYVSELAAGLAALFLASSLLVVGAGRMMLTDPALVLSTILAFLCFFRSLHDGPRWKVAAAVWLGVSVLAKGPVGCALFVILAAITYWREPALRPGFRGGWVWGTAALAVTVASWYLPAYLANGQVFVDKFLIEQNLKRFTGGDAAHTLHGLAGWAFYIPVLLLAVMPWGWRLVRGWPRGGDALAEQYARYAARWAWVVFLFFSISSAKLVHYILPVIPGLAIVAGIAAARAWEARGHPVLDRVVLRGPAWSLVIVALLVNFAQWQYYWTGNFFGNQVAPPHGEVHRLVKMVRDQPGTIASYQMTRRQADRGTGRLRLQEVSHPSLVFYARRNVAKVESLTDLYGLPMPVWILTRGDRIRGQDVRLAADHGFLLAPEDANSPFYGLYRLEPSVNP